MKSTFLIAISIFTLGSLTCLSAKADDWRNYPASDFSVPAPPTSGSADDKKDLATLHWNQDVYNRSTDCKFANQHLTFTFADFYADILSTVQIQKTQSLMNDVFTMTNRIVNTIRGTYNRPRPYVADTTIVPCVPTTATTSYPSGHATFGIVSACLLREVYGDANAVIVGYGEYMGDYRAIIGMHYPTDVSAGKNLGWDICNKLLADKDFLTEFQKLMH